MMEVETIPECPKRAQNLDINPADGGYIIYEPEKDKVHYLNPAAVLILEFCTGSNSTTQIIDLVRDAFGLPDSPTEEVLGSLAKLKSEGLLT